MERGGSIHAGKLQTLTGETCSRAAQESRPHCLHVAHTYEWSCKGNKTCFTNTNKHSADHKDGEVGGKATAVACQRPDTHANAQEAEGAVLLAHLHIAHQSDAQTNTETVLYQPVHMTTLPLLLLLLLQVV
jgi:hypothetical protein